MSADHERSRNRDGAPSPGKLAPPTDGATAYFAEADRMRLAGWLAALEAGLADRGCTLHALAVPPIGRATPKRRHRRQEEFREHAARAGPALVVDPARLPPEVVLGLVRAGVALASVEVLGPPQDASPTGVDPRVGVGAPSPSPLLGRQLIANALAEHEGIGAAATADEIAARLLALERPPASAATSDDLVACVRRLEEDFRRLADWSCDLAEQAADLERGRGLAGRLRAARRRVRRFLRKRGLR